MQAKLANWATNVILIVRIEEFATMEQENASAFLGCGELPAIRLLGQEGRMSVSPSMEAMKKRLISSSKVTEHLIKVFIEVQMDIM
jgi:hypothetical protein